MKKVFVELELPDLDKNDCDHIILQKIVSFKDEEKWQCVFCKSIIKRKISKTTIKRKRDEVQKKLQK